MKKVCFVAPVHSWDDVRVFSKEAVSLAGEGYDVTLIARADKEFCEKGVKVKPVCGRHGSRAYRFLSIPLIFIQAMREGGDVYHVHNPDTIPIAFFLKVCGKKVIYDTHEDFARRILMRKWVPSPIRKAVAYLVSAAESLLARFVDASIGTQEQVVRRLGQKSYLIGNPPVLPVGVKRKQCEESGEFRLVYLGGMTVERGLIDMVDMLSLVNKHAPARLWLIGEISESLLVEVKGRDGWKYVDYLGRKRQEDAFSYVEKSDVGLVLIHDVGDHSSTDPNKIYEYLAFGVPFLATNFELWMKRFCGYNCGWFLPSQNIDVAAQTIVDISKNKDELKVKGMAGRLFVQKYNWGVEKEKLFDIYRSVLST